MSQETVRLPRHLIKKIMEKVDKRLGNCREPVLRIDAVGFGKTHALQRIKVLLEDEGYQTYVDYDQNKLYLCWGPIGIDR